MIFFALVKRTLLLACLIMGVAVQADQSFKLNGFNEAILSVTDAAAYEEFFTSVGGWERRYAGEVSREQLKAWDLEEAVTAQEILMANKGAESGFIRLVQFSGVTQQYIRSNDQSWDTGGIFDLNIRVKSMNKVFAQMQSLNWQASTDPVAFEFGKFSVKEWIVRGPDGVRFALIERLAPKLEGWPNLINFSRTFNSTQIVRDMDSALYFYRDVLGFTNYMEHHGASNEVGINVLGLPHNLTTEISRSIYILHPRGENEGSIELLSFDGAVGKDFSGQARLPNLGIAMLRIPVTNIQDLYDHLKRKDVTVVNPLVTVDVAPYGEVEQFTVSAPEGALLEFYEMTK
jgi:catechol 2,3-dioxygenase-like lactoylglutathione lyase family enzyme